MQTTSVRMPHRSLAILTLLGLRMTKPLQTKLPDEGPHSLLRAFPGILITHAMHICKSWLCEEPHGSGTSSFTFISLFEECPGLLVPVGESQCNVGQ